MNIEFADIIIYAMYVAFAGATAAVVWSVYRRNRRGAGRLARQNGIRVRALNFSIWLSLGLLACLSYGMGGQTVVDAILLTMLAMIIITTVMVAWAMIRRV